ncbi:uncharacterized protein N7482_004859 [Penicillium canariense]|uniref:PLD phosphodiesterase domain-containing protein n=1 Tax=Penicillium canariense TaxID=189055 RepID=A0A9W9I9Z3_9EURO|nr:uncharacterized protein N7482_004859 [Penicillium canariense]KAJ5169265.1 hypothetical protein N7482_004859 [Penicillium canariense]
MITDKVYKWCKQSATVTSELGEDPSQCPTKVFKKLYESHDHDLHSNESGDSLGISADGTSSFEQIDHLQRALACGNWGPSEPSELFLTIYGDAISSLEKSPTSGVVSPPLMGSTGVVPLTIVAPLPDLCRHLANCIARAKYEVFLATNFWIHSDASTLVTNAIKELSKRAGQRGERIVMKMVYDRGDPRQAWENRLSVPEDQYSGGKVRLPSAEDIPNVDLQVINFHRPVFGTFHSKFTVIDRRIALLQSSNIQDNDNLEMLTHIEGPIVDSFYDAALLSWGNPLDPPFPLLKSAARNAPIPCQEPEGAGLSLNKETDILAEHTTTSPCYDINLEQEAQRINGRIYSSGEGSRTGGVTRHLNTTIQPDTIGDSPEIDQDIEMTPYMTLPEHEPVAMALVNREPYGEPLLQPLLNAIRRGVVVSCYLCLGYNDAGELLPFQNGTNEMFANRLYNSLNSDEEKMRLRVFYYVGKDQTKPIHNQFKKRSCHIKLMIVDEQIAIQGLSEA